MKSAPTEAQAFRPRDRSHRVDGVLFGILGLAALAVYSSVGTFGFVSYDDDRYVVENAMVQAGLTWDGLHWALSTFDVSNWHPVTWLSLMLNVELLGSGAGGFHWVNLALHLCAAALLYLFLRDATGARWRSLLVALLFATHPLHVESVAWVSGRKDVLSTALLLVTLLAYARYVRTPGWRPLGLCLVAYAAGLATKPMLVTLPVLLLLLDRWPLRRMPELRAIWRHAKDRIAAKKLLVEKLPFAALALVASALTLRAQSAGGAVESLETVPAGIRLGNALVSIAAYLRKMVWPTDLAIPYPHPWHGLVWWHAVLAALLIVAVSVAIIRTRGKPYLGVGWLWFLVALLPVLGLVQVGVAAMADRYAYVPLIGIYVAIVWLASDLAPRLGPQHVKVGIAVSVVVVVALVFVARRQAGVWQSTDTLFSNALARTQGNFIAHEKVGNSLALSGRMSEAEQHYRAALAANPQYHPAHLRLGGALLARRDLPAAISHFRFAASRPTLRLVALGQLGVAQAMMGERQSAAASYRAALALEPRDPEANYNLGVLLAEGGSFREAVAHFRVAAESAPDDAQAFNNLGFALLQLGEVEAAIAALRRAIQIDPNHQVARGNLKRALSAAAAGRK